MKKITFTYLLVLCAGIVFAQNGNLVIFAEGGERFTVIINGIKHNQSPQTNVRIENLVEAPYKTKIVFEDRTISPLDKTLYTNSGMENTYNIKRKTKDNSLVIRLASQTPLPSSPEPTAQKEVVVVKSEPVQQVTTTQTTTTTTKINNDNPNGESISMKVDINGLGMNVDIKDNTSNSNIDMDIDENVTYTETTTTTTTSSSGISEPTRSTSSNGRCDYPMDNTDFLDGKKSIESKTFADSKMTIAKQVTKANCPTAVQIRDYTKLFTYESDKLEYAKFAYDYCYDKGNYYKVNDAFGFESSIEELNEHIGN